MSITKVCIGFHAEKKKQYWWHFLLQKWIVVPVLALRVWAQRPVRSLYQVKKLLTAILLPATVRSKVW
jgi:hypothetical protein